MKFSVVRELLEELEGQVELKYKRGDLLAQRDIVRDVHKIPSKYFEISVGPSHPRLTEEQLLYLSNNPSVERVLVTSCSKRGVVSLSKETPPSDAHLRGSSILRDVVFKAIDERTRYAMTISDKLLCICKSKRMHPKISSKPHIMYPFYSTKRRYKYFISDPEVVSDPRVVAGEFMYIPTRFKDKTYIFKSPRYVSLLNVPKGLVPITLRRAKHCVTRKKVLFFVE
ncbi:hypothetical protein Pcinc_020686 [Petrolisthes cinctipes]|uniref:Uncharacterized protein n=1 Tax=Petrolisthes cinctipes TaxID=88211 RepID=A0AAE1FJ13_PETCI|nr:hypothetical protein Pcinc_020686 [Petrolisthes cinctipes]